MTPETRQHLLRAVTEVRSLHTDLERLQFPPADLSPDWLLYNWLETRALARHKAHSALMGAVQELSEPRPVDAPRFEHPFRIQIRPLEEALRLLRVLREQEQLMMRSHNPRHLSDAILRQLKEQDLPSEMQWLMESVGDDPAGRIDGFLSEDDRIRAEHLLLSRLIHRALGLELQSLDMQGAWSSVLSGYLDWVEQRGIDLRMQDRWLMRCRDWSAIGWLEGEFSAVPDLQPWQPRDILSETLENLGLTLTLPPQQLPWSGPANGLI